MIQILTRVRHPELYLKMQNSARETASDLVTFSAAHDDGSPAIAESYNLLGVTSMADILLFVHDDIQFLSKGWDTKIREALDLGFNVVGVCGSQKYEGGMIFDSGKQYSVGKVVSVVDGKRVVRLMEHRSEIEPCAAVDGMFMATTREHFLKTGFDLDFNGLFYYDLDFCLRSKCAVVDILVAHEKPEHLRGVYPPGMKPMSDYADAFNKKHGFKSDPPIGNQRCDTMEYADYVKEIA